MGKGSPLWSAPSNSRYVAEPWEKLQQSLSLPGRGWCSPAGVLHEARGPGPLPLAGTWHGEAAGWAG